MEKKKDLFLERHKEFNAQSEVSLKELRKTAHLIAARLSDVQVRNMIFIYSQGENV